MKQIHTGGGVTHSQDLVLFHAPECTMAMIFYIGESLAHTTSLLLLALSEPSPSSQLTGIKSLPCTRYVPSPTTLWSRNFKGVPILMMGTPSCGVAKNHIQVIKWQMKSLNPGL